MQNAADLFLPEAEPVPTVAPLTVELFEWSIAAAIAALVFVGIMVFSVAAGG